MQPLEIKVNGTKKKIEYSDKIARGIYFVGDTFQSMANCGNLKIEFARKENDNVLQNQISQFETFFVLTMRASTEMIQYIIFKSASKEDLADLTSRLPKETAELLHIPSFTS